jgi:hypothetical protein
MQHKHWGLILEQGGIFHLCVPKPVGAGFVTFCGLTLGFDECRGVMSSDSLLAELRDDNRVCPWCVLSARPDACMIPDRPSGTCDLLLDGLHGSVVSSLSWGKDKPR